MAEIGKDHADEAFHSPPFPTRARTVPPAVDPISAFCSSPILYHPSAVASTYNPFSGDPFSPSTSPSSTWRRPLLPSRLTRELEKKLSDKYIVFLSQRRVLPKPKRNAAAASSQKRPRSRTLTAVHEKMLEDLVWPSEIVGKRTRVATDGGKLIRVYVVVSTGQRRLMCFDVSFLDAKDANLLEYKLDTFSSVYRVLAGKDVHFERV